jgi:hypothetical protein
MMATQQVREKYNMKILNKGWLTRRFDSQQAVVITIRKASRYLSKPQHLKSKTSITPQSPLWRTDLTNETNHA